MRIKKITERAAYLFAAITLTMAGSTQAEDAAAAATLPPKPVWETTAVLGLTLTRGNSDTLLFTGGILTAKKKAKYELSLGLDGTYGENNNVKNNESVHGFTQYNQLFPNRVFIYGRVDGLHDAIADLQYRFTFSPGIGYYFIKNDKTSLSGEVGPGLVTEKQGGASKTYAVARLGEKFEHKFNDRARIWQNFEILPDLQDTDKYIINAEIGVESGITKKASLRVYVQDSYNSQPAPGRVNNDVKLVSALAYKF